MHTVEIHIERPAHTYKIVVEPGVSADWRAEVEKRVAASRYVALVDSGLADRLVPPGGGEAGGAWRFLRVEAGEPNKTLAQYARLCEEALALGVDRGVVVVAVGGGVVGDIAGFVAATLLRGVRLVQIPTTLLSQVDSSVGGKNGVNAAHGKNMVGTFHQPDLVLIDPAFLDTLPRREYLAGLAEIAKTAVLDGRAFFDKLMAGAPTLMRMDHEFLAEVIGRACDFKARVVEADEFDTGLRATLNLGHTFGHALESLAGYDGSVVHGEAVAVGAALAAEFSVRKGLLGGDDRDAILSLFRALDLPTTIAGLGDRRRLLDKDRLAAALLGDKKSGAGKVNLVLIHGIGDCRLEKGFDAGDVAAFMTGSL